MESELLKLIRYERQTKRKVIALVEEYTQAQVKILDQLNEALDSFKDMTGGEQKIQA